MTLQNGRRRKEMPTKAYKKKPKKPTWVWIYGDEMLEIWEHFGIDFPRVAAQFRTEIRMTDLQLSDDIF